MEENKLVMVFKNTLGNSFSITVKKKKANLQEQEIIDAMNLIKSKNIFQPKGYDIAKCVSAKVVGSTITEYDLVV